MSNCLACILRLCAVSAVVQLAMRCTTRCKLLMCPDLLLSPSQHAVEPYTPPPPPYDHSPLPAHAAGYPSLAAPAPPRPLPRPPISIVPNNSGMHCLACNGSNQRLLLQQELCTVPNHAALWMGKLVPPVCIKANFALLQAVTISGIRDIGNIASPPSCLHSRQMCQPSRQPGRLSSATW